MRRGLCLLCALLCLEAQAHRFAPSLLKLFEIDRDEYSVVWKTPAQQTGQLPLRPMFPANCSASGTAGGLSAAAAPGPSSGLADRPVTVPAAATLEGSGLVSRWRLRCSGGLVGQTVAVSGLLENRSAVLFSLETRAGYFYQTLLNVGQSAFVVPAEPAAAEVLRQYLWLGAGHIAGGVDHLLFVLGLLLLVGWGRKLLWTISAFTAGHSVTLSLLALGFFEYSVAVVEFAIALSVFVLALALARRDGAGLLRRHPWWLAGGFGLLHGMGFAGALAEVGLPQAELPLALLAFNLGIEFGQLAFIIALVLGWRALRGLLGGAVPRLLPIPVYILGSLSAMWCIERALALL